MKSKWIKIALMRPTKEKYFFMRHSAMSFQRGKNVIFCPCAFTPETTILYTWKGYFWSVTDHLRRWNITLREQLGRTAWGLLYVPCTPRWHRRTRVTWKSRSLHNDCPFLTGILSPARSRVSFTEGSTFLSKAQDGLLHLVATKTDFWNKIFHNHLLNEHLHCILRHLLLPRRLKQASHCPGSLWHSLNPS